MGNKKEYFAIFAGGGVRGTAYIGALKALEELNINLTGYASSSVGAIVASLISVGYNHEELKKLLEEKEVDKKVKEVFDAKDIRFATREEISELTNGVHIGGVPPFGDLFNIEVIADPKIFENEKIVFNAGDRCYSIAMKSEDYKKFINPKIENIT